MRFIVRSVVFGAVLAAFSPIAALSAQTVDPMVGVWKVDLVKSTYNPGKAPQSHTVTIVAAGDSFTVTSAGMDDQGASIGASYTAAFDGKDYPVTGSPDYSTVSIKKVDGSMESTRKKDGKFVQTVWTVLSSDGKHFVATTTGKNAAGKKIHNVAVYDKQ